MKYVGDILTDIRRDTRNEDTPTSDTQVGISTEDFLRYVNFAQEKCQAIAISAKSTKFNETKEISLVAGTILYEIPDNVYLDEHILNVEVSVTGLARDFYEIKEKSLSKRDDNLGIPSFYIRRGNSVLLCPISNSNSIKARVTYDRAVDRLDIRRGQILSSLTSNGYLAALTLDTDSDDEDALSNAQYLCINDAFGNVTMYNIPITGYNTTTGVVSIKDTSFLYQDGETADQGSYITVGKYSTTHSKLNSLCERYLAEYTAYKIFGRDSSSDATQMREDMKETLKEISVSYAETPRGDTDIVIANEDLILCTMI